MTEYEVTIGLEIHVELSTPTKLFCDCKNDPFHASEPNLYICPVCLALPGSLPVMNRQAVEWATKVGLALGCEIGYSEDREQRTENSSQVRHPSSVIRYLTKWDRKHYFYPDLPKGYQISQYDLPICYQGKLEIRSMNDEVRSIDITRIHLEEDTGKLLHPMGADYSLVDYNRAGVPLLELVTEPEIRTGAEAAAFAQTYQLLLRTLGVAKADMEKGGLRVEVNISLRSNSQLTTHNSQLGTKVEIKNLNSFRSVQRSIEYEVRRQSDVLDRGEKVIQETRGWDENRQQTFSQRAKETAADYRYFPEPDLPPITIANRESLIANRSVTDKNLDRLTLSANRPLDLEAIKRELPELPWDRQARYQHDGVAPTDAERLVFDEKFKSLYEAVVHGLDREGKIIAASLIVNKVFSDPALIRLVASKEMAISQAKRLRDEIIKTGQPLDQLLNSLSASSQSTDAMLEQIIDEVLVAQSRAVADYRAGKKSALSFLVGQVMSRSGGTADPTTTHVRLKKRLEG